MDNIQQDFFHGVDVPLVLKAIKSTGVKITQNVLDVAQDVVADAIVSHNPDKQMKLSSWVYSYIQFQLKQYITQTMGKSARNEKYAPKAIYSLDAVIGNGESDSANSVLYNLLPAEVDLEEQVMKNLIKEKLDHAIAQLDEREQFAVRFFLKAKNPPRCGRELGEALEKNGFVKYRGANDNKRSRAQQILQTSFKRLKVFLAAMGVDGQE